MEIEVGDDVAEFGMQMPSDALGVAYELPGAPRDLRKLGGADHQEGDNSDDQPMQRRERTVERHTGRIRDTGPRRGRPSDHGTPANFSAIVNGELSALSPSQDTPG